MDGFFYSDEAVEHTDALNKGIHTFEVSVDCCVQNFKFGT
jgi:hypothetical protein